MFGTCVNPSFMHVKIYFVVMWKTTKLYLLYQKLMEDTCQKILGTTEL